MLNHFDNPRFISFLQRRQYRQYDLMHLDGLLPPDRHLQQLQKSILLQISLKGFCQVKQILILSAIDPWAIISIIDSKRKGL